MARVLRWTPIDIHDVRNLRRTKVAVPGWSHPAAFARQAQ
jgi:hypothetical protein